jgi:hypothetical protein
LGIPPDDFLFGDDIKLENEEYKGAFNSRVTKDFKAAKK